VPFPFSDLTAAKIRPAVRLAGVGRGDWVLCQITSNPYGDPNAVPLDTAEFAAGGLLVASFARPGKLFTANRSLIVRSVGKLHDVPFERILDAVIHLLRPPSPP
jgi:mRNA interferase MazF